MASWICPKCGNNGFEQDQIQATGGTFSKFFDIQNKKYTTISCTKCGYTEFYKATTGVGENVLDFLFSNH